MNEKEKEGSIISDHTVSISADAFKDSIKISLPEIVLNTIPNLVYLDSYNKSNLTTISIEQRFPDEIINWMDFKQKVQIWQPESDKKYQKPIFRSRNITCEKDIWSATDANIFDILTSLEQHIYFSDGRAIKNIVGEPDFVIVDNNKKLLIPWESKTKWVLNVLSDQNIVTLYNEEKKIREGPYAYSSNISVYHPINQIYGYMCANKLRYTPFLERPIMVSDNVNEEPDSPDREQKDDSEFKYKGNFTTKKSQCCNSKPGSLGTKLIKEKTLLCNCFH
ncbi:hypothetical protein RhiirB3_393447 [Rhizophagus irregularis]|nr:hypothetical protein RhiirB3_393447 [Rhizophagus irregularis]